VLNDVVRLLLTLRRCEHDRTFAIAICGFNGPDPSIDILCCDHDLERREVVDGVPCICRDHPHVPRLVRHRCPPLGCGSKPSGPAATGGPAFETRGLIKEIPCGLAALNVELAAGV
jgi:hypothetical protein